MASTSDNPGQSAAPVEDSSWDKTEKKFSRYVQPGCRLPLAFGDFLTLFRSIPSVVYQLVILLFGSRMAVDAVTAGCNRWAICSYAMMMKHAMTVPRALTTASSEQ